MLFIHIPRPSRAQPRPLDAHRSRQADNAGKSAREPNRSLSTTPGASCPYALAQFTRTNGSTTAKNRHDWNRIIRLGNKKKRGVGHDYGRRPVHRRRVLSAWSVSLRIPEFCAIAIAEGAVTLAPLALF